MISVKGWQSARHAPILSQRHVSGARAPITRAPCETGPGGAGRAVASRRSSLVARRSWLVERAGRRRRRRSASVICTMPPWSYGVVLFLATRAARITWHHTPRTRASCCLLRRDRRVRRPSHRRRRRPGGETTPAATTNASVIPPSDICPEKVYTPALTWKRFSLDPRIPLLERPSQHPRPPGSAVFYDSAFYENTLM